MEKSSKSLGEWSINVDQESGDAEMNQEGRKEEEKGKGLERPVISGATSEVPYKVNPLRFTTWYPFDVLWFEQKVCCLMSSFPFERFLPMQQVE